MVGSNACAAIILYTTIQGLPLELAGDLFRAFSSKCTHADICISIEPLYTRKEAKDLLYPAAFDDLAAQNLNLSRLGGPPPFHDPACLTAVFLLVVGNAI